MTMPPQKFIARRDRKQAQYARFTERKDRRKIVSVVLQLMVIAVVAVIAVFTLTTVKTYQPYTEQTAKFSGDRGFIALSYFGVERVGQQDIIGAGRLQEHLQALKNLGYVTITQQDLMDYYQAGKELPEKSLFLMFEDGRRDTAAFSQKILENLNFKATILTYPEKFASKDPKFLIPEELKDMERTTYWETGTNGYRLAFINVFDRYDNYLGELDQLEQAGVAPFLGRRYNHYVMDYIRDEYGIPKESHARMKERISHDYETLHDSYIKAIGYVPATYILMHANTGAFGNNDKVSAVNEYWIKNLFKMNFNREGFALNQRNSSIYDLTRMQPQPYWYTNHLLMRIQYDSNQDLDFVQGNLRQQENWDTLTGALEIQNDTIVLTSLPQKTGLARLKNRNDFGDIQVSVRLRGNKVGLQRMYFRADENLSRFLSVYVLNNVLYVTEKNSGAEKKLFTLDLNQHAGKKRLSVPEDRKAAEVSELETFRQYAASPEKAKLYEEQLRAKEQETAPTVADGAVEYIPEISLHTPGDHKLIISLKGDRLRIVVDDKEAVSDLPVADTAAGAVFLESAWGGYGQNQPNLVDDVYDGVFEKLVITENTGEAQERILFDSSLEGLDAVKFKLNRMWEAILSFFVR
ncbi:glycoside hydrolase [Sporomusa acidovorans]|uniref:Poly-beta-1,6-N-acetyl-D-glucosamine N-deacetylase n=1 Tax=Sporomusa acidovorans (strain ATCC 49682 / DSM 3132 / Mol) TaxID=1123286 RepID=A0ABZ3JB98_SPOA4|nr:glycoside hydrolase [Sporomusa acidovorans]OZC13297.1 hypothetical protein SPACI_57920 [Sporomusa acidovorans DSM 3132]SDD97693.1 hypothetical protein SAMN04488499_100657 [Sporomusa acidovorans]